MAYFGYFDGKAALIDANLYAGLFPDINAFLLALSFWFGLILLQSAVFLDAKPSMRQRLLIALPVAAVLSYVWITHL